MTSGLSGLKEFMSRLGTLAQTAQSAADPALHRSERTAYEARDIFMRVAVDECQLEALGLLVRQQGQTPLHQFGGRQPSCGAAFRLGLGVDRAALGQLR